MSNQPTHGTQPPRTLAELIEDGDTMSAAQALFDALDRREMGDALSARHYSRAFELLESALYQTNELTFDEEGAPIDD